METNRLATGQFEKLTKSPNWLSRKTVGGELATIKVIFGLSIGRNSFDISE